ncbi:purine-cytosine permease family protein [Nocardia sp. NPDC088792]|uniref:purine-cytosine permease family protein n=1 Tax=Nocardia sp. NPDC088792 TaxID=3364332 RepID=UPI0037F54505
MVQIRRRTGGTEGSAGLGRRIGGEIETVGVAPVPESQRTQTSWKIFIVWLMASASATTPLIGALLFQYGLTYMIAAIVVSWLIAFIPAGLTSEMGRQVPLNTLVVARKTYGWDGSLLFSILFTVVNFGWFGLNTQIGAEILAAITHSSVYMWDVIVGGVQIILVLFGMKWLERFYRYTALLLVAAYLALAFYLVTHYTLHYPGQTAPMNWGMALTTVLTFSVLGWIYSLATTTRFAVPWEKTKGRAKIPYFLAPSVGIMLAVLVFGVLGAYSQSATGDWNIALLGAHISGWGFVAALGAALAVIHTNAMNLYPSTASLLVAINNVHKPTRWEQPLATIGLGILGTALAIWGILNHVETLITDAGDITTPFIFVILVDWLYVQRRRTPATAFFDPPRTLHERVVPTAIVAVAVGFALGFWGDEFLPSFFYNVLPLPVVAGVVSAILYGLAATFWHPPHAVPRETLSAEL